MERANRGGEAARALRLARTSALRAIALGAGGGMGVERAKRGGEAARAQRGFERKRCALSDERKDDISRAGCLVLVLVLKARRFNAALGLAWRHRKLPASLAKCNDSEASMYA